MIRPVLFAKSLYWITIGLAVLPSLIAAFDDFFKRKSHNLRSCLERIAKFSFCLCVINIISMGILMIVIELEGLKRWEMWFYWLLPIGISIALLLASWKAKKEKKLVIVSGVLFFLLALVCLLFFIAVAYHK